ncbi:MAG: hypothetical protein M3Z04_02900, partial [Chloroflexota bacterium]|nr:hypothetical protein [Chloroflexota bacterium]
MQATHLHRRKWAALLAVVLGLSALLLGSGPARSAAPAVQPTRQATNAAPPAPPAAGSSRSWTHLVNVAVNGTILSKTSPPNQWDSGAVSALQALDTGVSATVIAGQPANTYMFGISHDDPDANFLSINYALFVRGNQIDAYHNGVNIGNLGSFAPGDQLQIYGSQSADTVYFYRNNTTLRVITQAGLVFPMLMDTSIYSGQISNGEFVGTGTLAAVPTVIPAPTGCAGTTQTINASIGPSDPSHTSIPDDVGAPSSCGVPKTCPATFGTAPYNYDSYSYSNTSGSPQCITVQLDGSGCGSSSDGIQAEIYANYYDPTSFCTNYLGDTGNQTAHGLTTMSVTVPGNTMLVIVVEEYTNTRGCA